MPSPSRTVSASELKARCLALLDEVAETRTPIVVTKRGVPLARLMPIGDSQLPSLLGSVRYESEAALLSPADESWDADR